MLTRNGRISTRNMDKPYKAPKKKADDTYHDPMAYQLNANGYKILCNGSEGDLVRFDLGFWQGNPARIDMIERKGAPGKRRQPRKKKNGGKTYGSKYSAELDKGCDLKIWHRACARRARLHRLIIAQRAGFKIGLVSAHEMGKFHALTREIERIEKCNTHPQKCKDGAYRTLGAIRTRSDQDRKLSVIGEVKKKTFQCELVRRDRV